MLEESGLSNFQALSYVHYKVHFLVLLTRRNEGIRYFDWNSVLGTYRIGVEYPQR